MHYCIIADILVWQNVKILDLELKQRVMQEQKVRLHGNVKAVITLTLFSRYIRDLLAELISTRAVERLIFLIALIARLIILIAR